MSASRRVARAVSAVLNAAPRHGEVSMARLVQAVAESRDRPIEIQMEELPPAAPLLPWKRAAKKATAKIIR